MVKNALKLHALTFLRPGDVRELAWEEVDFEAREIRISGKRMKMKRNEIHTVPLSKQALELLQVM